MISMLTYMSIQIFISNSNHETNTNNNHNIDISEVTIIPNYCIVSHWLITWCVYKLDVFVDVMICSLMIAFVQNIENMLRS